MARLSRLRDLQVQMARLKPLARQYPCLKHYLKQLQASESLALNVLAENLCSFPQKILSAEVEKISAALSLSPASGRKQAESLRRLSDRLHRIHGRLLWLRSAARVSDPAAIHRLRVAFKKYRYLAEPLAPFSSNPDPAVMDRMHDLQGIMGDIQDLAVLRRGLRNWAAAGQRRGEADPVLQWLARELEERISVFQDQASQIESFAFDLCSTDSQ